MDTPSYSDITKLVGIMAHMQETHNTHGERVSMLALRMAAGTSMSSEEIAMLEVGAKLHDIGKLLIRRELLNASRKLSLAERADLEAHAQLGYKIVSQAGYADMIQQIVLSHHEKWDGTGYPHGLKGNNIPMYVQIVSICDVYEAMTHSRPYREGYSHEFVISYLKSREAFDFSPELVDLFVAQVSHG